MARRAAVPRQLSSLVSDDDKAFLLGCADVEGTSEADVVRALIAAGVATMTRTLGDDSVRARLEIGRAELARRDAEREARARA